MLDIWWKTFSIVLLCIVIFEAWELEVWNIRQAKTEKRIQACIEDISCIHTTRHLKRNIVDCVQDKNCYTYLKERI